MRSTLASCVTAVVAVLSLVALATSHDVQAKGTTPKPPSKPPTPPPPSKTPPKDPLSAPPDAPTVAVKPKPCVELLATWDAALALAKGMSAPIVLHIHAFASADSWVMHDTVMGSKGYMDFDVENAVDVILLTGVEDAVAAKDKRAATYEATTPAGKVRFLVELPGLSVADLSSLEGSKAKSFSDSNVTPFTALIDPFTETAGQKWTAVVPAKDLEDAITAMKKTLETAHGRGDPRKDVKAWLATLADADAVLAKEDFAGAVAKATAAKSSKSNNQFRTKSCDDEVAKIVAVAQKALDAIEARKTSDLLGARKDLAILIPKLKGTGLEGKASALMDNLK
jgi:hypothetical protein